MRPSLLLLLICRLAAADPAWRYEVKATASDLSIEATFAPTRSNSFSVDRGAEPFVKDVTVEEGHNWRSITPQKGVWRLPARGCHVRYHFRLREAADALDSEVAERIGDVIEAPPSTWLLHPGEATPAERYRFHVEGPFVSGVHRIAKDTYEAEAALLDDAPFSAFGPLSVWSVEVGGGTVELAFVPSSRQLSDATVAAVIARAAECVAAYFGRFPIDRALVLVLPTWGDSTNGRTLGNGGVTVTLRLGVALSEAALRDAWVPAHELTHIAFPTLEWTHSWIAEGLATYLEPVARARAGDVSPERFWRELVEGLPNGLPAAGDHGLDQTHTWGRTYWGGALFCLMADLEIRERTGNRRSLDDALRAIVARGGNLGAAWTLDHAFSVGDEAIGLPILTKMYASWRDRPVTVDLAALWVRLGVRAHDFDDSAPLAAIRRAITARSQIEPAQLSH